MHPGGHTHYKNGVVRDPVFHGRRQLGAVLQYMYTNNSKLTYTAIQTSSTTTCLYTQQHASVSLTTNCTHTRMAIMAKKVGTIKVCGRGMRN